MTRLMPRSLFGQTLLVLLAGLIASYAVGSWLFTADREEAVRAVGGYAIAQRITNLTRLVQDTPRDQRERLVGALSDQTFRVAILPQPPAPDATNDSPVAQAIGQFLATELALPATRAPRVSVASPVAPFAPGWHGIRHGPMMQRFGAFGPFGAFRDLQVAVPLSDGEWLAIATSLPASGPAFSRQFLISAAVMAIIVLVVSVWAVRRVTAPLASLSAAAERLGRDLNADPLPDSGTIEMRQASQAFNAMQTRLRGLIDNRTRMLAAVSHDLRTPLTLLRLRVENVEDPAERDKMLATIAEMEAMIAAILQFARDETKSEPRRRTDLTALLASVVDDFADGGLPVSMEQGHSVVCECQPTALKRALKNLIENALKYGQRARARIGAAPDGAEIVVDDDGPGIPEDELTRVFQPFYRVESSRSRDTGGIGLGLATALSLIEAQGGTLTLSNRPEGGLRARIALPVGEQ